jgi:hypothetical protein
VAGGQGHAQKNQAAFAEAGYNSTFADSFLAHTHVARPSEDEVIIAELVRLGTINSKSCGSSAGELLLTPRWP